jgi:fused signal recognition particle receptor
MFKFLRKKLKKFEDELEAELQVELEKETEGVEPEEPVEKPELETIDEEKIVVEEPKDKIAESKPRELTESKIEKLVKKPKKSEELTRKRRIEKRRREEHIDKQIEKSIETELEHTLRTRRSIEDVVKTDRKTPRGISEEKLNDLLWDLEIGLLESDVAYSVIESIKKDIKEELKYVSFEKSKISELVENVLRNAIAHVLKSSEMDFDEFIDNSEKPVVIMFVGVNGSGKTLSIGKMATLLKKRGKSSVMAAGDTFRAGAIEQLGIHANNVGVKLVKHGPSADPAAVAFDAIEHAKAKHKDVVLVDTAGRMQTNVNLMDEMAKIKRVAKPDLILFVGDALAGNDAVEQAKRFNEIVGIDGVILTKVDTDAKGGSALSVAYTIGKPLLFIGVGQGYEDQIPFDPQWMIDNIFGK